MTEALFIDPVLLAMGRFFDKKSLWDIKLLKWKKEKVERLLNNINFQKKYPATIKLLQKDHEKLTNKINKLNSSLNED